MQLREHLESKHSKATTLAIVKFVGDDKTKFKELVLLVLNGDDTVAPRAAWPMSYIVDAHPALVTPWIPKLLDKLSQKNIHPGIKRNILRAFEFVDIPEKQEAKAVDVFFAEILNPANPPAIIAFAITAAAHICNKYPELKTELNLVLDPLRQQPQPPSIISRLKSAANPKRLKSKANGRAL